MGAAFLTKMLEGFLPLPAFALTYLLLAPTGWRNRLLHLLAATAALVAAAGWWVLTVQLVPATRAALRRRFDRQHRAATRRRIQRRDSHRWPRSRESSQPVSAPRPSGADGPGWAAAPGLRRLFTAEMANEISWLLPAALLAVAFGVYLVFRGRLEPRRKGRADDVHGLAAGERTGVQLHGRHGPPVLHRRDGARRRRAGRHRRRCGRGDIGPAGTAASCWPR